VILKISKIICFGIGALLLLVTACNFNRKFTPEELSNVIVYVAYSMGMPDDIYLIKVEPDAQPIRITYDNSWEESPIWVDGGNAIVFNKSNGPVSSKTRWFICKIDLVQGKRYRLVESDMGFDLAGNKNIYVRSFHRIYILDGDSLKLLFSPRILPISSELTGDIWDFSVDKAEARCVLAVVEGSRIPPGGKAYKGTGKFMELVIVDLDSTNFQFLTSDTFPDSEPAISPDGRYIVYSSRRGFWRNLYIIDLVTRESRMLVRNGTNPTWSPDGKRVAFISNRDGHAHIYVINVDGTGLFQLTKGDFDVSITGISWSPR
jgi:dipeptidyl aminopeptidase/acylaminoacyl peptidase